VIEPVGRVRTTRRRARFKARELVLGLIAGISFQGPDVFPTLNATRRNVADCPGLPEIKRRGQGARENSPLSSGPPDFHAGNGGRVFLLLLLLPSPPLLILRSSTLGLCLLLFISSSSSSSSPSRSARGSAASTWRMLRNASSGIPGEGPEFHGRRKGAERVWR